MKKFERLIIYPLLIVALFFSLPDGQITTATENIIDKLVVREISVVNDEGVETINIKGYSSIMGGEILVDNLFVDKGHTIIDAKGLQTRQENYSAKLNGLGLKMSDDNYQLNISNDSISIRETLTLGEPFNEYAYIGLSEGNDGMLVLNNSRGDNLISMGADIIDGHGVMNIYDKHGEDYRSYTGHSR